MKNSELYYLFCDSDKTPIVDLEIIVSGGFYPINFKKGALVISRLDSIVLSEAYKNLKEIQESDGGYYSIQKSKIQLNYQCDIYKEFENNYDGNFVYETALKVREWLKTYDAEEYLDSINCEILPCYSKISFDIDYSEQKRLVNRAYFEFSIIENIETKQQINIFDKITIENKNILN